MNMPNLEQLAIVAESTSAAGPGSDDHFLVLVFRDGGLNEVATSDPRAAELIRDIEKRFDVKVEFQLANKTDLSSRIVYPLQLRERPLWAIAKHQGGLKEMFKRIKSFGATSDVLELTPEVRAYLGGSGSSD